MEINYHISPYPSLNEAMIAKAYETQSPLAEVASKTIPTPHNNPATIIFTGLDRIPHIVRLFTNSGVLLHEFDIQPTENIIKVFSPIFFQIGDGGTNTPAAGSTYYTNPDLASKTNADLTVFANGELKYPAIHYNTDLTGGFHLLISGDVFEDRTQWMVQQKASVVTSLVNDSVVAKIVGGFLDVANVTANYDPTHLRKLVRLSGAQGQYNFPSGVAVPIGYSHKFTNFAQYNALTDVPIINFNNAQLLAGNTPVSSYLLPYGSIAEFTFDGTNWNLVAATKSATVDFGRIIYMGRYQLGNIVGVSVFNISIPVQPDIDYWVTGSLYCQSGDVGQDDNCIKFNSFYYLDQFTLLVRELNGTNQNLRFDYQIMRKN